MKIMSCKDLGGACAERLSAETWEDMVRVVTMHVMDKHPRVAKEMVQMHKRDPKKWGNKMKPKWDATPEA